MKKIFTLIIILGTHLLATAQFVTPGNGTTYTLQDLVDISTGTVTSAGINEYHINDDLTISLTDILNIQENVTIKIAATKRIFVNGTLISDPDEQVIFTAINPETNFRGFRFEGSNNSVLRNTIVEYGGGIQLLDTDMIIEDCIIRYNDRSNTSAAVNLSNSSPLISNNIFLENKGSAIGSGANIISAPQILNNQLIRNSSENTNRPQINMGPTGGDTLKIIGNTIEGFYTMAGGIAVSNLLTVGNSIALIEDNLVFDNRYGYTATGNNIMSIIRENHFLDNDIQGVPAQGGSGLNFYGGVSNVALVYNNKIQGNLWGITIQLNAIPNIGEEGNAMTGYNLIQNNGNGGQVYGLFNNTPEAIMAQHNYWGTDDETTAGQYIVGQHQDPTLGPVTYLPMWVPQNLIESFTFTEELNPDLQQDITGVIDQEAQTITLTVPYETAVTSLIPQIQLSPFASVIPQEGMPIDFTQPVAYTVTSFHEADRVYEVNVEIMDTPSYTLTFVVNDTDGEPVNDAVITLNGEQHPEGIYVFPNLVSGSYDYLIEKEGYLNAEGTITIDDQDLTHEVILTPTYTVTFVVSNTDGEALTNAVITLNDVQLAPGEYVFTDMPAGSYDYLVELQGYTPAQGTVVITDQDIAVDIVLDIETSVSGPALVNGIAVYPNPARDYIEVNFSKGKLPNTLRIYSISGTLVMEIPDISPNRRLDVSHLDSGLYLMQFTQGQVTLTRKLTIRR